MPQAEFDPKASANTAAAIAAIGSKHDGRLLIEREKGKRIWIGKKGPDLDISRKQFAEDFLKKLNRELWLDGMWAVCWTNWTFQRAHYTECHWLYLDKDMDVQFLVTCEEPIEVMWNNMDHWMDNCVAAWETWRETLQIVGVKPGQKIKAAIGQASADKRADPGIDLLNLG
jgi:hypothetical protein